MARRWPGLAARPAEVGGITVTCAQAAEAAELLEASRTSAIAPVLRAAGSPLAGCDYFAAAAPYLAQARELPKTGRVGAAGRHVTKHAFLMAITAQLAAACASELAGWRSALAADERYASAMARDAVSVRQRAHAASIRSSVRSAVSRAITACGRAEGEFTCTEQTACGTGSCRFAQPPYWGLTVPAGPGRLTRPANHAQAGLGFSETEAAAQMVEQTPWRAGVPVADCRKVA
jgi:hypothetical protein